ncbi:hypothetical protein ACFQGT_07800 [Natrialbaceae archaeon GCM10025810]|uniref:hypothetical protein n=1 Tax=Halovalidus salilacus TaxID=3075124 RepID=UPI003605EA1A
MTGSEPFVTARELAATLDGSPYDDTWRALQQYERVVDYSARHPEKGSVAVANALEISMGRARSWVDDGRTPIARTAIDTADDLGWLNLEYDDATFQGMNALVANVFSGGYIPADRWEPYFVLNERGYRSHVLDALELVGVDELHEAADDRDNAAPRVRPAEHSALLGRVLSVLGAPRGKKSTLEDIALPAYLEDAPDDTRELFVQCYLANRSYPDATSDSVQINERRPREYRDELAALIEDVAGERVTSGEETITISAAAARSLGLAP